MIRNNFKAEQESNQAPASNAEAKPVSRFQF